MTANFKEISMEATETIVNLKEIEKDLQTGLANAESNTNEAGALAPDPALLKPRLELGAPLVKLACRIKNGVQFRMVTKNLPEDIKSKLQHFNEVKDNEVAVYKAALDQYGSQHLSPELIGMINKYANSPLAPLIEFEIEKFQLMQAEVKILSKQYDEGEV
jgi:hypothetical protein